MAKMKASLGPLVVSAILLACSSKTSPTSPNPDGDANETRTDTGPSGDKSPGADGDAGESQTDTSATGDGRCPQGAYAHDDGLCHCQADVPNVCDDVCVDNMTDPDHCGDCATKCGPMQGCNAGHCGATPVTLIPAAAGCGALHLAWAGGTLYWTDRDHGTVKGLSTTGGAATTIASGQMTPTLIAASGAALYWLESGAKRITKATLPGGAPTPVAASTDAIGGFVVSPDGNTIYFSAGKVVNRTSTAGGGAVTEVGSEDSGIPGALALDGANIAFATHVNGDVDVMTIVAGTPSVCASPGSTTATNTSCARIARSQDTLFYDTMYAINGKAYWAAGDGVQTASELPSDGFNDRIGSAKLGNVGAFAILGTSTVFYSDDDFLLKAPLMANAPVSVWARAQPMSTSIALDATKVYWATADCAVVAMPQ
jgi:hypothetical protein